MTAQPRPRLVVDTNVLVPAVIGASASPPGGSAGAGLIRARRGGLCALVVSDDLVAEYEEVLQRRPFGLSPRAARALCARIRERAICVTPARGRPLLTADPDDDMVLKTAVAGKADLFLVTDNRRDFLEIAGLRGGTPDLRYRGVAVVGLSACLDAIRARHADATKVMRSRRRWP